MEISSAATLRATNICTTCNDVPMDLRVEVWFETSKKLPPRVNVAFSARRQVREERKLDMPDRGPLGRAREALETDKNEFRFLPPLLLLCFPGAARQTRLAAESGDDIGQQAGNVVVEIPVRERLAECDGPCREYRAVIGRGEIDHVGANPVIVRS